MNRFKFAPLLAALGLLLFSDVGETAKYTKGRVVLVATDQDVEIIAGVPDGAAYLGYYKRLENTQYLPGVIETPKFPPNPCNGMIRIYNRILVKFPPSVQRKALRPVLRNMAKFNCAADLTRDQGNNPQDIISMQPVP